MAINLDKVRAKLKTLETRSDTTNHIWKPEPGTQVIRIVPYVHNLEFPFIELLFNYEVSGGRSIVSPVSFGRPDPINEFAKKLKTTGNKDDYKLGKKIEPKERFFAAVIVRGEESEGVRFWGFGKLVYTELLKFISDPDYGDITDLENGRDITIEFKTEKESSTNYPQTDLRIKPNISKVGEPFILKEIQNQKKIEDVYIEPTYEDLDKMLAEYLSGGKDNNKETDPDTGQSDNKNEEPADKNIAKSAEDLNEKFKTLFAKKQ